MHKRSIAVIVDTEYPINTLLNANNRVDPQDVITMCFNYGDHDTPVDQYEEMEEYCIDLAEDIVMNHMDDTAPSTQQHQQMNDIHQYCLQYTCDFYQEFLPEAKRIIDQTDLQQELKTNSVMSVKALSDNKLLLYLGEKDS